MRIIRDVSVCPEAAKGAIIALGNFDGVHRGHQAILAHAAHLARAEGRALAALTFEPHPREFFAPTAAPIRIYPFRTKAALFSAAGIEQLFALRFDAKLAATSAQDFVTQVLHNHLQVAHVVSGYNFFFGHKRQGDRHFLAQQAQKLGFGYTALEPVHDHTHEPVSSSRIRALLASGDVSSAADQLGHSYRIGGIVRQGHKRGREMGFPTANLSLRSLFLPRFGVYAVRAHLAGGQTLAGVANLGINPTFGDTAPVLETYLFDFSGDIYGQRLEVELVDFIREESRFADIGTLRNQISKDADAARELLMRPA